LAVAKSEERAQMNKAFTQQLALCIELLGVQLATLALRNTVINVFIQGSLFYAAYVYSQPLLLLLQPLIIFALDVLERFFGITVFSREQSSIIGYNRMRFATANPYGGGVDLGFNFYNGDYKKEARQAQVDKFEHAFKALGLKEGMRVLDCGCGMGDWLYWLKHEKQCTVVGINMTHAHVNIVRQRGMECVHSDWQSLYADEKAFAPLRGRFDAVTLWDTIEHYCKASEITWRNGLNRKKGSAVGEEAGTINEEYRIKTYGTLFKMARDLLDPSSECGNVWTSCLHQTHSWKDESLYGLLQIYFMTSYYDGVYPFLKDGLSKYAPLGGFTLAHEEDRTEDYRMTSLMERDHFGYVRYSFEPCALLMTLCTFVTDPHWAVFHLDLLRGLMNLETCWMWHMGGVVPHEPAKNAIAQLLWQVYSKA